ncbi:hypothetical protein SK803_07510 [Lentzea sp. BCCO 10_0856]|uniref:Uncharacterized protein n=1 Tax=Lentzea miocenica TaxID=3095431 RepID=A0ABU4SWD1_9PSEU|nr:hypothetical protein [Lentzea sp. BCCO 10_0856]MDX8030053.1 hypothetical protein [Lentzea sp. BCCO 10_0856]
MDVVPGAGLAAGVLTVAASAGISQHERDQPGKVHLAMMAEMSKAP